MIDPAGREEIDGAAELGPPVTITEDTDGSGSPVVFGDVDDLELCKQPTWRDRVKRLFRRQRSSVGRRWKNGTTSVAKSSIV